MNEKLLNKHLHAAIRINRYQRHFYDRPNTPFSAFGQSLMQGEFGFIDGFENSMPALESYDTNIPKYVAHKYAMYGIGDIASKIWVKIVEGLLWLLRQVREGYRKLKQLIKQLGGEARLRKHRAYIKKAKDQGVIYQPTSTQNMEKNPSSATVRSSKITLPGDLLKKFGIGDIPGDLQRVRETIYLATQQFPMYLKGIELLNDYIVRFGSSIEILNNYIGRDGLDVEKASQNLFDLKEAYTQLIAAIPVSIPKQGLENQSLLKAFGSVPELRQFNKNDRNLYLFGPYVGGQGIYIYNDKTADYPVLLKGSKYRTQELITPKDQVVSINEFEDILNENLTLFEMIDSNLSVANEIVKKLESELENIQEVLPELTKKLAKHSMPDSELKDVYGAYLTTNPQEIFSSISSLLKTYGIYGPDLIYFTALAGDHFLSAVEDLNP